MNQAKKIFNDGGIDRRTFLSWASALAGASGVISPLAQAADPFRIGWVRPTTGRFASSYAQLYVIGLMAIDEINAAGGIMGRPIEKVEIDDEAAPAKEPAVIKRLQGDGIQYVVGPTGDAQCMASLPSATQAKMIQGCFTHGTKSMEGLTFPYHYVLFHSVGNIADICIDHFHAKGARKIGILVENTSAGEAAIAASKPSLARYKLEPTTIQTFPLGAPTVVPYMTNLKKADTEVILSFLGSAPPAALVLNALAEMQWYPTITGHAGLQYESLLKLVPKETLQNASSVSYRGLTWAPGEPPSQRHQDFGKKLLTYPDVAAPHNIAGGPFYDFLYLLKHVIEQEKSFDVAKIKPALDKVRGFVGIRGRINFSAESHGGVAPEDLVLSTVLSQQDPRSMNSVFRQRLA